MTTVDPFPIKKDVSLEARGVSFLLIKLEGVFSEGNYKF